MNRHPRKLAIAMLALLAATSGCRWNQWLRRGGGEPPPIAFAALPSREEALAAINANAQRIQTLSTQGATASVPGFPAISAEVALQRPRMLRFRAGTNFLGPELDVGSNDELFWLWAARSGPQPAVYFARHDQFGASRARQMLALEPTWLIEALGVVEIDPAGVLEGPTAAGNDRVQLRTTLPSAAGQYSRLVVFHKKYAWVLEQHVYDERGQLIASSRTSDHEYYPLDGVSLAKRIEVQVPANQMRFQLDIDRWAINQPPVDGAARFELPRTALSNYPFVDIADPSFVPPGGGGVAGQQPEPRVSQVSSDEYRQRIRGIR